MYFPATLSRESAAPSSVGVAAQSARRLTRELESLEESLVAAERAALACQPTRRGFNLAPGADVDSRRAELERWEIELQERERSVERQRTRLEQIQDRMHRAKESLKRAVVRFRADVAERTDDLDARARQLAQVHAELVEARREFAREQIRQKAAARGMPDAANATLPDAAAPFDETSNRC